MIIVKMNIFMIVIFWIIIILLGLGGGVFGIFGSVLLIVLLFNFFCFMKL